jgi:hypothetical protein
MEDYGVMLYLLFDGQKFIRTCYTYEEAIDLAKKKRLKHMFIKRAYDADR